jgi:enamine deaminase RidA (YjgF/YER057c/UK114 family)
MSVYDKLQQLGITLPALMAPVAAFVPYVKSGRQIFVSGHIAKRNGEAWVGKLGAELNTTDGQQAARAVAIDLMGTLHAAVENLDNISRIVKLMILVNSAPGFTEQHLVANGASLLLVEVFGDAGAHARSAFGVAQLPLGPCLEIEMVAEMK